MVVVEVCVPRHWRCSRSSRRGVLLDEVADELNGSRLRGRFETQTAGWK